jgi:hypothetical protein
MKHELQIWNGDILLRRGFQMKCRVGGVGAIPDGTFSRKLKTIQGNSGGIRQCWGKKGHLADSQAPLSTAQSKFQIPHWITSFSARLPMG